MGKDEDAGRLSDVVMESASCKCVRESAGFLHPFANETQDSVYRKCVYMQQTESMRMFATARIEIVKLMKPSCVLALFSLPSLPSP